MKYLVVFSLILVSLISFNSCGDDSVNNNSGSALPDFDIYLVKEDFQNNLSTYTIKSDGSDLKLFNDSLAVSTYSYMDKILLSKYNSQIDNIYIADYDGSNMKDIPLGNHEIFYFNLSPDASKLFFISLFPAIYLYVMNTDGLGLVQISDRIYNSYGCAKFSPNGEMIAYFERSYHQFASKLLISNTTGTFKKLLKDSIITGSSVQLSLDWSHDGSRIIYHDAPPQVVKICVIDTSGSNYSVLTNGLYPAWSPNGDKICFVNFIDANAELYLMDQDGTDIVNISNTTNASEDNIKWSKDGLKILYTSYESGHPPRIWMYDLNSNSNTFLADSSYRVIWQ